MNYIYTFLFFCSSILMACPYCAGSTEGGGKYTVIILSVFIALVYIPFYVLFRMIFTEGAKSKDIDQK